MRKTIRDTSSSILFRELKLLLIHCEDELRSYNLKYIQHKEVLNNEKNFVLGT